VRGACGLVWLAACHGDPAPVVTTTGSAVAVVAIAVDAGVIDSGAIDSGAIDAGAIHARYTIDDNGVGPLDLNVRASAKALAELMPGTWTRDTGGDAEGNLIIYFKSRDGVTVSFDDKHVAFQIAVTARDFATAAGIHTGDTVAALAQAYADLTCRYDVTELTDLACTTPSLGHVEFGIDQANFDTRDGAVAPKRIAKRAIFEIRWR
jgi:hypothetical protein